ARFVIPIPQSREKDLTHKGSVTNSLGQSQNFTRTRGVDFAVGLGAAETPRNSCSIFLRSGAAGASAAIRNALRTRSRPRFGLLSFFHVSASSMTTRRISSRLEQQVRA